MRVDEYNKLVARASAERGQLLAGEWPWRRLEPPCDMMSTSGITTKGFIGTHNMPINHCNISTRSVTIGTVILSRCSLVSDTQP